MTCLWSRPSSFAFALVSLLAAPLAADDAPASVDANACIASPTPTCLLAEAALSAPAIEEEWSKRPLIHSIASAMADAGDVEAAQTFLAGFPDMFPSAYLLAPVAQALARAGRDADALALFASPEVQDEPERILAAIGLGQAQSDRLTEASETAARITDPVLQARVLVSTLDPDPALERVATLPAEDQEALLAALASRLARQGDIDAAFDVMYMIADPDARIDPRAEIARAQTRAGLIAEAITTAKGMSRQASQVDLLLSLMRIAPDPLILEEIHAIADGIPESARSYGLVAIVMATLDPDGPYPAVVAADLAATENPIAATRNTLTYAQLLSSYGNYPAAAALAFGITGDDQLAIGDRIYGLTMIARAMNRDAGVP